MICNLCPRRCNKKRNEVEGQGFCGMPAQIKIAHYGFFEYEEPCISLNKGSGSIFFSGCNLNCVFCQNYEISSLRKGKFISVGELAEIFKKLEDMGAENINLVSPMHYANLIVDALKIYKPKIPVVYNTNSYESEAVIDFVAPYVDIFLADLKYYSSELSKNLSGASDYFDVAYKAIKAMAKHKKCTFNKDKMLTGVIIRHMILPLCTDDSIKILNIIKSDFKDCKVSLMSQYTPMFKAKEIKGLNRSITLREYKKVLGVFKELNLNGYYQELSSVGSEFVPKFCFIE